MASRSENPEKCWIVAPVQGLKLLFQDLLLRKKVFNPEYSKQSEKLGIPLFANPPIFIENLTSLPFYPILGDLTSPLIKGGRGGAPTRSLHYCTQNWFKDFRGEYATSRVHFIRKKTFF